MAIDRNQVKRYLANVQINFCFNDSGTLAFFTASTTSAAIIATAIGKGGVSEGVELYTADPKFLGWDEQEIVESIEGSDYEVTFNATAW